MGVRLACEPCCPTPWGSQSAKPDVVVRVGRVARVGAQVRRRHRAAVVAQAVHPLAWRVRRARVAYPWPRLADPVRTLRRDRVLQWLRAQVGKVHAWAHARVARPLALPLRVHGLAHPAAAAFRPMPTRWMQTAVL